MVRKQRTQLLKEKLFTNILLIDGAMGTALQEKDLTAEDFGGEALEGCNENLIFTRPDVLKDIHLQYLEAGADIIETNTFGGTPLVLAEYDLEDKWYEVNFQSAKLARECADEVTKKNPNKPRFVAGSMGPTTKAISVTGGVSFEGLVENFKNQARALYEGDVDYFLLETCQDTRNIKAALIAIDEYLSDFPLEERIPVAVSGTIEPMGTMLAGQAVDALVNSLEHVDLLYLGLNCATGPEFMTDHIRTMAEEADCNIACVPNAGLPDEEGNYLETPAMLSQALEKFIAQGWINLVGGCCGTTPRHIKAMGEMIEGKKPRTWQTIKRSSLSGIERLNIEDDNRPIIVGERTNVIGSRKFKRLIVEKKFDEAAEIAKAQVKNGAQVIDVCLANPDSNEYEDMKLFLEEVIKKVKVPLMIDSTDEKVVEESLKYSQGKAIINSINLEDGEERFEAVVPLAKKYGAALVVGCIDDDPKQGMGVSRERKLEIAGRSYDLLTTKYGVAAEDIYFDPLVFPCATGDENYIGSAEETIEGIRLIKEKFPKTKTVLGISNISFGLPAAGREVLNSVFTYLCTEAGLDMALVNSQLFKRYASIDAEEIKLAEDLLFNRGEDPIAEFAAFYRDKKVSEAPKENLPLMERIPRYVLDGTKEGLYDDLNEAMKEMQPMEIINGPLMSGMSEVGKLFNENKLIVAEVLQSAEAMKAAVGHLEPFMEKGESQSKGKVLLATVKGDVHDIGKNLVDIVLTNNGYEIVNLGIKIPSDQLIEACKEHEPDMIGLSGLLVKSAQQMVTTAGDMADAGINTPILVGGAALSKKFVVNKIAPEYNGCVVYAKDAMNGLDLANTISNEEEFEKLKQEMANSDEIGEATNPNKKIRIERKERSTKVSILKEVPSPQDYKRHLLKNTPIDVIWNYLNPLMLYGRHLGVKGKIVRLMSEGKIAEVRALDGGEKAIEIYEQVEKVKELYKEKFFIPKAVYQYYSANSKENDIIIWTDETAKEELARFNFPRQDKKDGLCLSDYLTPVGGKIDNIGMFCVTVGEGIRELSESLKNSGNYLHSHIVAALALESAEAYAEFMHGRMRSFWGHPDDIDMTPMEMFQAKYHGKRYSFGYPACPRLDDQAILFDLLKPADDIDVQLTDGFMMEPEASVSAIAFHHPEASYFSVGDREFMSQ